MGYKGLWVFRAMGYEGFDCTSYLVNEDHARLNQEGLELDQVVLD